jgi:tryptophan synthase alpha chain
VPRIDDIFSHLRQSGRKALMPFVCAGFPGPGVTAAVLPALERAGASIIEVGIPFSDPIADGSVIAAAMHEALAKGATPLSVFDEVAQARPNVQAGLVAMVSFSIVAKAGGGGTAAPQRFAANARQAGFDGLIVPDCPLEESQALREAASAEGLSFSLLIAPSTPPTRAEAICKACTGFVYLLARAGITGDTGGDRGEPIQLEPRVTRLREMTDLPIAVGFGISTADQVRAVVRHADAAIVGSALVKQMSEAARQAGGQGGDPVAAAEGFIRLLGEGLATPAVPASGPSSGA